jgi:hypothetical protein
MAKSPNFLRISIRILVAVLSAGVMFAAPLTVVPGPGQNIVEGPNAGGNVTFTVTNPNPGTYVLDYALAIINGPAGDDLLTLNGVNFPTLFPQNVPETFTYPVLNPNGDVGDPDNGLNTVSFYIEASPATPGSVPQFLQVKGLGFFVFLSTAGSLATGPTAQTLADLTACTVAPGALPDPCPAVKADPDLYVLAGQTARGPNPSSTTVNLLDNGNQAAPEPATAGPIATGLLLLGWAFRRRFRKV